MDIAQPETCAERLALAFDALFPAGPSETIYLGPIFEAARRIAHREMAHGLPTDRDIVQTTLANLDRALAARSTVVREPLASTYEIQNLLLTCIPGRVSSSTRSNG